MRSQIPLNQEESSESPGFSVRDILADYRAQDAFAPEEAPAPTRRSLSASSLSSLQAEPEEEEGVRIYQPRRDRAREQERLAARWGEKPLPPEPEPAPEPEEDEDEEAPAERPTPGAFVAGLLSRFGRGKKAVPRREKAAPAPEEARELPSFEELVWGEEKKKSAPVRIVEEPEPEPARPIPAEPAPTEPEIHIPESELNGLSVDAILSDYWAGFTEDEGPAPAEPVSRRARREQEESARREKTRPAPRRREERPAQAESAPRKAERAKPAPAPLAEPTPAPQEPIEMSVSDILSEFWANYSEEETPAPREDAPRSRREAARRREEDTAVPPTGAAPSAAANKPGRRQRGETERTPSPRRSAAGDAEKPETRRASRSREPRKNRRGDGKKRPAQEAPPIETFEAPPQEPRPAPPAPVDPAEPAALFGFLRRPAQNAPSSPAPEAAPKPGPRRPAREARPVEPAQPKEIKDEDVEFGTMSVDDILAEYNDIFAALPAAASAIGAERAAEAAAAETEAPAAAPEAPPAAAKPAAPRGNVSRMEAEAQDLLRQMRSGSLRSESQGAEAPSRPSLRRSERSAREHAKPAPAPKPAEKAPEKSSAMPSVEDAEWGETLRRLLGQDPAPPQPAAAVEPSRAEPQSYVSRRAARSFEIPSDEVDPRFNLSGERKSAMVFGDKELDLSPEEGYVPPKAAENVGFHWVAGEEELPEKPVEKKPLFGKAKKAAPKRESAESDESAEGYDDRKRPEYAPDKDYSPEEGEEDPGAFPSFGQYLSGMVSGLLVRLLGVRRSKGNDAAGTMEDEDEDLGPEVSPAAASKYYGSFVLSLRMRLRIGLVLLLVMAWIALGLPVSGALRSVQVAAGMVLAIQLTILLLGLDVVTGAAVNLARGRFGADSLAVLCCVLTSLDALAVTLGVLSTPHMPLCLISSASFLGVLLSSLVSARALRKALRVPAIGKRCYGVTAERDVKGSGLTLLKSLRPPKGFVRRTEEASPDETAFTRLSPLLAAAALLLALIVAIAKHAFGEFLYILSVLLCPAVPLTALLAFALPYLFGSLRIFHSGAAIAGWSGVCDIGTSDNLIVTDRDLFPEGSVVIDTVRIFAEMAPETIISYAGTMVCASGSDLAPCFAELMEKNGCPMRRVEGFEYLSGGGMKGVIDGSVILCGGLDLMRLMNVRVPYRLVGKTTVLLAVDGILCGIFNMKYEGQPQVRKALVGLIRSNRHPIFAIRDFLVTPEMLSDCFDVATDGYDFPPYVDRFAISEAKPSEDSKLAAVVCREGLGPLSNMADTGRSVYMATRINLLLTILAAVLGVFVCFFRLLSVGTVASGFLLVFLVLWALPVGLVSIFLRL